MAAGNKVLLVIVGPTAVGKTSKSIELANALNTEIVSADSRQFYKELKIGVASPTAEELAQAKHHFIGHISIHEEYNAYKFEIDAVKRIETLFESRDVVILTGGSGLYIDAICFGIDLLPDIDKELRSSLIQRLNNEGLSALLVDLGKLDPVFYKIVDKNNPKRVLRALEVCLQTGKPYSKLRKSKKKERSFKICMIGINRNRNELHERIALRVNQMMEQGLLNEVKSLWPYKNLNALNTVGYREFFPYFEGKCSLEEAVEKVKTNTRRFARRQITWFNRYQVPWLLPEEMNAENLKRLCHLI